MNNQFLLEEIFELDEKIRADSERVLDMRNDFLRKNGWSVESELIGPSITYFYRKDDQLFICEHEAIDREIVNSGGKMTKWISVEDRLPEYERPIIYKIFLQSIISGICEDTPIIITGHLELLEDGPAWVVGSKQLMWDYDFNLGFSMDDVIEWMPEQPEDKP